MSRAEAAGTGTASGAHPADAAGIRVSVLVPAILQSYTDGARHVELAAGSHAAKPILADILAALDARFPGFRFRIVDEQGRIRAHIKVFVNGDLARDLATAVPPSAEVMIVGALSGG